MPRSILRLLTRLMRQPQDPLVQILDAWGGVRLVQRAAWQGAGKYLRVYDSVSRQPVTKDGEPFLLHRGNIIGEAPRAHEAGKTGVRLKSPNSNC